MYRKHDHHFTIQGSIMLQHSLMTHEHSFELYYLPYNGKHYLCVSVVRYRYLYTYRFGEGRKDSRY